MENQKLLCNTNSHYCCREEGSGVVLLISPTHSEASFLLSQAIVVQNQAVGGFSNLTKSFLSASNCLIKTSLGCPWLLWLCGMNLGLSPSNPELPGSHLDREQEVGVAVHMLHQCSVLMNTDGFQSTELQDKY